MSRPLINIVVTQSDGGTAPHPDSVHAGPEAAAQPAPPPVNMVAPHPDSPHAAPVSMAPPTMQSQQPTAAPQKMAPRRPVTPAAPPTAPPTAQQQASGDQWIVWQQQPDGTYQPISGVLTAQQAHDFPAQYGPGGIANVEFHPPGVVPQSYSAAPPQSPPPATAPLGAGRAPAKPMLGLAPQTPAPPIYQAPPLSPPPSPPPTAAPQMVYGQLWQFGNDGKWAQYGGPFYTSAGAAEATTLQNTSGLYTVFLPVGQSPA